MRFARFIQNHDQCDPQIASWMDLADLDVAELSYRWPDGYLLPDQFATGFLSSLATAHQAMFLDPALHLVTDAGGGSPSRCGEAVGGYLCENGSEMLPMTVIRGSNQLPRLEELAAEGIAMTDRDSGESLADYDELPIAASIQIGGGPIATAFAEGSRLVIAGDYDPASPLLATAVTSLGWSWKLLDPLGALAVASHLPTTIVSCDSSGQVSLQDLAGEQSCEALQKQLVSRAKNGCYRHADVVACVDELKLERVAPDTCLVENVVPRAASDCWNLRVTIPAGYRASASFSLRGEDALLEEFTERLGQFFDSATSPNRAISIDTFTSDEDPTSRVILAQCQSQQQTACLKFIDGMQRLVLPARLSSALIARPLFEWKANHSFLKIAVPRDAIAMSVDTRSAREWR